MTFCSLRHAAWRTFATGLSYTLTAFSIAASLVFVLTLTIALMILFPIDLAYRAVAEMLRS